MRRETIAVQHALQEVYAGDQSVEAAALLDRLDDIGFEVREKPRVRPASTAGLSKGVHV